MSPRVVFLPEEKSVEVPAGTTLMQAAIEAGIEIKAGCGGEGTCGRCKVRLERGEVDGGLSYRLTPGLQEEGYLLSCTARIKEEAAEVRVFIPEGSRLQTHRVVFADSRPGQKTEEQALLQGYPCLPICRRVRVRVEPPTLVENTGDLSRLRVALQRELGLEIGEDKLQINMPALRSLAETLRQADWDVSVTLAMFERYTEIIKVEPGGRGEDLGIAVDVGTTSNVVYLVDLTACRVINRVGDYNRQARYGDDVISRIIYAVEKPGGLQELQEAVTGTINSLVERAVREAGYSADNVVQAVIAGNTTMTHLLWGITPKFIRLEPYIPTVTVVPPVKAREIGLKLHPEAVAVSFPQVAGYVGGDIVSGALFTRISEQNENETVLFVDIGTNGEMVLGNKDWLVCCACSAGPAFEGGGITSGMRAATGAIESAIIDPFTLEVKIRTVNDAPPAGICGSGLIELLFGLFDAGIIDRAGNFQPGPATPRLRGGDEGLEFVLSFSADSATGSDLVITEGDIKNLIRAKAAVYAGIRTLLKMVQLEEAAIGKIIIAGGFGSYLNIPKAVRIGLLPDLDPERYTFVGNSSVKGACLALLSAKAYRDGIELGQKMTYLELSAGNTFMDEFVSAMFLPHTDLSLFPNDHKTTQGQTARDRCNNHPDPDI